MGTNRNQAVDDKGNDSDYTTTILQPLAKFHSPSFESHGEDTGQNPQCPNHDPWNQVS